jgi:L-arabinose isomerase
MNVDLPVIGLFGIGLDTYWPQFEGLKDRLVGYQKNIAAGLGKRGVDAHCQACAVPEIANVFNNAGLFYDIVTGWLDDNAAWNEIGLKADYR